MRIILKYRKFNQFLLESPPESLSEQHPEASGYFSGSALSEQPRQSGTSQTQHPEAFLSRKAGLILFTILLILIVIISGKLTAGPLLLLDSFNAKGFALGQSDVAEKGDLDTFLVNPSGLAGLNKVTSSALYLPWYEEISWFSFSFGYPLFTENSFYGTVGLNLSTFYIAPFPNYDKLGNRKGDLSANDLLFNIGYGYPLLKHFDIGLNFKYFNTKLDDVKSSATAVDIGSIIYFGVPGLLQERLNDNFRLGMSVQNIGSPQKFIEDKSPLPYKVRIGMSYLFVKKNNFNSSFMLEFNRTRNQRNKLNSGLEIGILKFLKIRMGYKLAGNTAFAFSFGSGICYNIKDYDFDFDYSLIPLNDLGVQHAFSLKFAFGDISEKLEIREYTKEMKKLFQEKRYTRTAEKSKQILTMDPLNIEAKEYLEKVTIKYLKLAQYNKKKKEFQRSFLYWKNYLRLKPQDKLALSEISILKKIISDDVPPEVLMNDFQETNVIVVNTNNYLLSGEITDNKELKIVKINYEMIDISEKNRVQINKNIELIEGENSIEIYVEDQRGNKVEKILKIIYNIEELDIEELEPIDESDSTNSMNYDKKELAPVDESDSTNSMNATNNINSITNE